MYATLINAVVVILGGLIGTFFGKKIAPRITQTLMMGLALIVAMMGIQNAITTEDILGMILCLVFGTILGELIGIEKGLDRAGKALENLTLRSFGGKKTTEAAPEEESAEKSRFVEGVVAASLLFCVGSMSIMGSLQAGINGDGTVILSKSIIDCVAAVSLSTTLGIGVIFSALVVLVYQGIITLSASLVAPLLSTGVVNEMTAIGGLLLIGVAYNMLDLGKRMRVANMLPAMLLPILYQPLVSWLGGMF